MPRPTLPRYLAKVPCPWWDLEGPPYHPTLDPRPERRSPPPTTIPWTFAAKVGGVGGTMVPSNFKSLAGAGGGPENEVPVRFSSSALVRPSVTHGAHSARVGGRPTAVGGRRPSFGRAAPKVPSKGPPRHHTLDPRPEIRSPPTTLHWTSAAKVGGWGDLEGPTMARYLGKVPWQGGTWHFDLAFTTKAA